MNKQREYLTAVSVWGGVIQLIEPNGEIGYYAQRGIKKLNNGQIGWALSHGKITREALSLPELPKHYSIAFEDEEIMGKARATLDIKSLFDK